MNNTKKIRFVPSTQRTFRHMNRPWTLGAESVVETKKNNGSNSAVPYLVPGNIRRNNRYSDYLAKQMKRARLERKKGINARYLSKGENAGYAQGIKNMQEALAIENNANSANSLFNRNGGSRARRTRRQRGRKRN